MKNQNTQKTIQRIAKAQKILRRAKLVLTVLAVMMTALTGTVFAADPLGTINSLRSVTDSAFGTADYYLGRIISGKVISIEDIISMIEKTTPNQVVDAAAHIKLDTVYFLKGSEQ